MAKRTPKTVTLNRADFAQALLAWYDSTAVFLPWRASRDPYRIWLSEIMLQQTRIATVSGYYERFLQRFPDVIALATAPLDEVLKLWEGLGYYSRARNLHRAAQVVVNKHNAQFPASAEALQQLPGIGRYTAAAIASIAFNEPVAVLDGNVIRVLTRLYDYDEEISTSQAQQQLWQWAQALLPEQRPGDANQAMMDLGRMICVPRNPLCANCPVKTYCQSFAHQTQHLRPVKKAKAPLPTVRASVALIRDTENRLLLVQRPPQGLLGGLWTLPGGQCAEEESFTDCLERSVFEEFGLRLKIGQEMALAKQTFTHFHLLLRAYQCEGSAKNLKAIKSKAGRNLAWATVDEMEQFSFGKADREIINKLSQWQPRLFEES